MYELSQLPLKQLLSLTVRENTASELLSQFPTLKDLAEATTEELSNVKGQGQNRARQLLAAMELGRRLYTLPADKPQIIRCPQDVFDILGPDMQLLDREHFRVINLSTKNAILSVDTVSIGGLSTTVVHPRETYKGAVRRSSAAILAVHNHPSGDPTPSKEDIEVTKRLAEAGKLLSIELFDHVIIGHGKYVSLKEKGIL
jgi:DNA repair protein RadC